VLVNDDEVVVVLTPPPPQPGTSIVAALSALIANTRAGFLNGFMRESATSAIELSNIKSGKTDTFRLGGTPRDPDVGAG
jgi:hypothetical protein